ncbi:MAG: acylglycerol kinase family protein, partial [Bacteroidales bacterium]
MQEDTWNQQWFVIVNPNAGNGKGKRDWTRISDLFERNHLTAEIKFTERKGHAIDFAIDAISGGFRKIISVGGDGTLNEIVNGVFLQNHCSPKEITLGMIPIGTGNDWGRMFGIPLVYEGAIEVIKAGKTMLHD